MNISKTVNKILRPIESNAQLIGGALGFIQDPMAQGDQMVDFIKARLQGWKVPDLQKVWWYLMNHEHYSSFRNGIKAGIAGWILEELGGEFHPSIKRVGKAIKNLGTGAAIGSGIGALVWLPAINPHGNPHRNPNSVSFGGNPMEGAYNI